MSVLNDKEERLTFIQFNIIPRRSSQDRNVILFCYIKKLLDGGTLLDPEPLGQILSTFLYIAIDRVKLFIRAPQLIYGQTIRNAVGLGHGIEH